LKHRSEPIFRRRSDPSLPQFLGQSRLNGSARGAGVRKAAFLAGLFLASPALAAPAEYCRQLEADLAASSQRAGTSNQLRRYERALETQERQIAIAEGDWQRSGCGYQPRDRMSGLCASIENTLERMSSNMRQLTREHAALDTGRSGPAERRRIQLELDEAGCRDGGQSLEREAAVPTPRPAPQAKLRTMCVRTCDGYFFPLSYGVTREDFGREAKACQATCPSTEMRLFYHKVPDEEASAMVSAEGDQPYSALPTANLYRNGNTGSAGGCGCAPAGMIAATPQSGPQSTPSILVLPDQARPQEAPDPTPAPPQQAAIPAEPDAETPEASEPVVEAAPPPEPAPARPMSSDERRVRVVGPTFLPAQEEAIDLRAPGRTNDR
jgi:hypothetical protein